MRKAARKSDCSPANGEDWQLLVLGYRGTLKPESREPEPEAGGLRAGAASDSRNEFADFDAAPPQMEALTEPLLAKAQLELERRIPEGQSVFGGERIPVEGLIGDLRRRLEEVLTLTVGACLMGPDAGATLTERDLAREFPELERLLRLAVSEWVIAAVTFCERLCRDGARLAKWMGVGSLPPVESVCGTAADTHPGGHVVLRVVFEGGRCIYYKPRAVTGEWLWHKLLETIAEVEPALDLPAGRVLEGSVPGRYGWMESVRPADSDRCGTDRGTDGSGYWHAAGAMLCLAYHAALTDLHLGNVIATPRGPVVTDAECLGTPRLSDFPVRGDTGNEGDSSRFVKSIEGTGLLPGGGAGDMPDISGLFGGAGPASNVRLPRWSRGAEGRYRLTTARAFLCDHDNAPIGSRPLAVVPELLSGYREAASTLLRARRTLIGPGTRWRCVLEHEHAPRIVVRDTLKYGLFLSRSLEPAWLGAGSRRRVSVLRELQQPEPGGYPRSVLREELHALLRLHVPRLILLPGTRTLASHSGRALARGFAQSTPGEEIIQRMEELSAEHVDAVQVPALLLTMFRAGGYPESR